MNKLREKIDQLSAKITMGAFSATTTSTHKEALEIEEELWQVVELAMTIQQNICGGHKI